MKKKCKIIMLPTDDESRLYKAPWDEPEAIGYFENPTKTVRGDTIAQHLYLISDDEIKEGDWALYKELLLEDKPKDNWVLTQVSVRNKGQLHRGKNKHGKDYVKKVIASTDSELKKVTKMYYTDDLVSSLPTFSEDFIKAYVEANGEIDEVMVEYDSAKIATSTNPLKSDGNYKTITEPKLTDNNEVIISQNDKISAEDIITKMGLKWENTESLARRVAEFCAKNMKWNNESK